MNNLSHIDLQQLEASAARAVALLKALSNEKRLMILCQLGDRELQVGALRPLVGLSQSALSQHLALLREEGLVANRREGQAVFYRIADPAAVRVIATLAEIYCHPSPE
ncbi:metalloregulator ArsR/SmtB family transcription factor [Roseibacterium beibuensis]|uniref:ArsR/SmtB family transcription factor n=1 Tax=[Roseibacterium] beibuensis TaxID=1193142 RepID=UPI00217DCEB4|nr:metalloregulator ArsR/SmtB family transcription factor [Roseibacterium beibuensis]MCS6626217.1 metalloregulator ArsR/SmtB family transcription factor [Roseibacterium beibuensis]